ncbi:carbohydrate kinase family protein [Baekduia soli]|uniref:Carbohydrate kinase family protein n=1 Tax=Baekduia soli TaxID=496014 RepID=A0A5B8UBQ5_9ACTN|nr:carbohydrate kinase family protein [Baekduia soli]QEC50437.1 carbohydrate kinase family protein [Baekduia soli]
MTYDVVVAGPPFLDLGFLGLPRLPRLGEELHATGLVAGPGGAAITAIAAARLGLRSAVAWPVGDDAAGRWLAEALAAEEVAWVGPRVEETPVTAIMALDGDRAMVTRVTPTDTADPPPDGRALVTALDRARAAAAAAPGRVYAMADFAGAGGALPDLTGVRALVLNAGEARRLTGKADVEAALGALVAGTGAAAVVVTRGALGAIAAERDGAVLTAPSVPAQLVDATGAGDVFAAAYVWADLAGLALADALALAVLAGALAVSVPSGAAGARACAGLAARAQRLGLALPGA